MYVVRGSPNPNPLSLCRGSSGNRTSMTVEITASLAPGPT